MERPKDMVNTNKKAKFMKGNGSKIKDMGKGKKNI